MKLSKLFFIFLLGSTSAHAADFKEEVLGNVVAVKRSFGFFNFEECQKKFKPYLGDSFFCEISFPDATQFVPGSLKQTYIESTIDPCKVILSSGSDGYMLMVEPKVTLAPPVSIVPIAPFTQAVALECARKAIQETDLGKLEITAVVLNVKK